MTTPIEEEIIEHLDQFPIEPPIWITPAALAKQIERRKGSVAFALEMMYYDKCTGVHADKRRGPRRAIQYRLMKGRRYPLDMALVNKKLEPFIAVFEEQARTNLATVSIPSVAFATYQIYRTLEALSRQPPEETGPLGNYHDVVDALQPWLEPLAEQGRKNTATFKHAIVSSSVRGLRDALEQCLA